MSTPLQELIETTRDGFVLVSPDGGARYANQAAKAALGDDLRILQTAPALRAALVSLTQHKLTLPAPLQLSFNNAKPPLSCDLIHAPMGTGIALLVHPQQRAVAHPPLANVLELIRSELLNPVKALVATINRNDGQEISADTTTELKSVASELEKLVDFATVFGEERIGASDRIVIQDLVHSAWKDLSAFAGSRNLEVSLTGFSTELPPIYGNREWLLRVIRELLDNAIRHSNNRMQPGSTQKPQIELSARQLGPHMVISIRNAGLGQLQKVMDRVFLPFNKASAGRTGQSRSLSIGLPLVHKLVELHGGRIKIGTDDSDNAEFVLELPTGAPQHNAVNLNLEQAKRYAQDIGKLLARRKKNPDPQVTT